MCLKAYTEAEARRPYGFRLPDLVYILSSLFIMNITEMIGISLRIVLRCFHDLMFCCVEK